MEKGRSGCAGPPLTLRIMALRIVSLAAAGRRTLGAARRIAAPFRAALVAAAILAAFRTAAALGATRTRAAGRGRGAAGGSAALRSGGGGLAAQRCGCQQRVQKHHGHSPGSDVGARSRARNTRAVIGRDAHRRRTEVQIVRTQSVARLVREEANIGGGRAWRGAAAVNCGSDHSAENARPGSVPTRTWLTGAHDRGPGPIENPSKSTQQQPRLVQGPGHGAQHWEEVEGHAEHDSAQSPQATPHPPQSPQPP